MTIAEIIWLFTLSFLVMGLCVVLTFQWQVQRFLDSKAVRGLRGKSGVPYSALRERLAEVEADYMAASRSRANVVIALQESQADVRALVAAIEEPGNSKDFEGYPTPWAKALDRPNVKRLMEEQNAR